MSRKQFIESQGAICNSWYWSWSFVNHKKKFVIFGAWDQQTVGNRSVILAENWEFHNGRHKAGYTQAREHLKLVEEKGYKLKTFPMVFSDKKQETNENGPAVIKSFTPRLYEKKLQKIGVKWYAVDDIEKSLIPEEITDFEFVEGSAHSILVNAYERNSAARKKCLEHYGTNCFVCGFDFEKAYGEIGKNYIHVHHLKSLSQIRKQYKINPIKDLRPVCPNCHAMIHRYQVAMDIDVLKNHMQTISK